MRSITFAFIFFFNALFATEYAYFIPPQKWEIADPKTLSPLVKMKFVGPSKEKLKPSINLAIEKIEKVDVTIDKYIAEAKKVHESDPHRTWRDLGKFSTPAGEGRLTEISSKSEAGNIRLLQLILFKNHTAYVVTAAALKGEFSSFYQDFHSVFRTFTLTSDLVESVPDAVQRQKLQVSYKKLSDKLNTNPDVLEKEWPSFQNEIIKNFSNMGAYWQILFLQSTREKLTQGPL